MERKVKKWELKERVYSLKAAIMRIAICNRNKETGKNLKNKIYEYCAHKNIDAVVENFSSGEELLGVASSYNLVFLDYELDGRDGLDIANEVKKLSNTTAVILCSDRGELVFKAFEANVFRFLLLPLSDRELFRTLDSFFEAYNSTTSLLIKSGEELIRINVSEILFLEANNKHCVIYTTEEAFECNKTMARVYEMIKNNYFGKIHRAYVVNLSKVKKFNSNNMTLCDGTQLHISRKYFPTFKEQYINCFNPLIL